MNILKWIKYWFVKTPKPLPLPEPQMSELDKLFMLHYNVRNRKMSDRLNLAASMQSKWMAENDKLSHVGEMTLANRAKFVGYDFIVISENIASGQESAIEVFNSWMNSIGHRNNIENTGDSIGIAMARSATNIPYWCVVFASEY